MIHGQLPMVNLSNPSILFIYTGFGKNLAEVTQKCCFTHENLDFRIEKFQTHFIYLAKTMYTSRPNGY